MNRFRNPRATPPGGCYEYGIAGLDSETVSAVKPWEIERKVRELRTKHGLPMDRSPMSYVMDYMCPRLPDGFCSTPSLVKTVKADEVKHNTMQIFSLRCATNDVIERRMSVCVECPQHTRRGFCVDCTGLLDWIYRAYAGRRGKLPADRALGVCICDEVLAAAGATAAERELKPGAEYPENCWRVKDAALIAAKKG